MNVGGTKEEREEGVFLLDISAGTIVKIVLVLIGFYALYLLSDLVMVLLLSIVVASAVEPAARWGVERGVPRALSVLGVYLAAIAFFSFIFYFFVPPIIKDFNQFFHSIPSYLRFLDEWNPWRDVFSYQVVLQGVTSSADSAFGWIGQGADAASQVGGGIVRTVGGVFSGIVNFILVLVISFYLAVQENGIENFLKIIVPVKHEKYVIGLWKRSQGKIGRWIQGQFLLGVLVGTLVFLGLAILGVPHAFIFAVIAAVFELIPIFGPILAAIPAVAVAFGESVGLGLTTLGLYVIIQQFENHLIYPVVVRKVVGVPPILVIIALLVGAKLGGVVGIILSVPLAAAIMEYVNDVEKRKAAAQGTG